MLRFRTPYNVLEFRGSLMPRVDMDRRVRIADTDIDTDSASFSDLSSQSSDSYYTNSDVPIKVYGNGILTTAFNPMRQNANDVNAAVSDKVASRPLDTSTAAASAVAASAAAVSNSENS